MTDPIPRVDPPPVQAARPLPLRLPGGKAVGLAVVIAIIVGVQLGAMPYRYRKQIWQLQGAVAGFVAGYLLGRLSRAGRE